MNDRELLELAAKAAKVEIATWSNCQAGGFTTQVYGAGRFWNPLTDDGDAFRMAAKLRIDLTFYNGFQEVHAEPSNSDGLSPSDEKFGDDIGSSARRAIVRAAAEIGRSMP